MSTHLSVSAELDTSEVDANAIENSAIFYMEGYLAASPTGLQAAMLGRALALKAERLLALTLSDVSMIQFCRTGLQDMLGEGVDYLFANEAEIKAWFSATDFEEVVSKAAQLARTVCITRGNLGCVVLHAGEVLNISAPQVTPVDTNGAGDMFAGAFLYAVRRGHSLMRAGTLATKAASAVVAQHGNRMATEALQSIRDVWLAEG
jgi:sugar/nucleoside kinase (ribokinase family)